jgi:hypothetical protein
VRKLRYSRIILAFCLSDFFLSKRNAVQVVRECAFVCFYVDSNICNVYLTRNREMCSAETDLGVCRMDLIELEHFSIVFMTDGGTSQRSVTTLRT